jgi:secondary thiamine-phosphate synthase enzyme
MTERLSVPTGRRCELVDVTDEVARAVDVLGMHGGAVVVHSPHTTAGVTINEGYDPDVADDLLRRLDQLAPAGDPGDRHSEGNSDAHLKTALVGTSVVLPLRDGGLALGRWQRIFLCEFDGPRRRELHVSALTG